MNSKDLQEEIKAGIELFKNKKFNEAKKIFEKLKENIETKTTGLFFLGVIQLEQKNVLEAKNIFLEVIKIEPNHEDANLSLGIIFLGEKKYENALDHFKKIISVNENNINALYHIGLAYFYMRKINESINFFDKCIKLNKNHLHSYLMLGHSLIREKKFKLAIENYKKVLEINPKRERTKFNLSWCYFALFEFDKAFEFYEFRKPKLQPSGRYLEVTSKFHSNEWKGQDLTNKTIMIICEQGYGDNINFFRYLFWLNEKFNTKIIFYCHKKLKHLFQYTPFEIISDLNSITKIDYYQHLLSLPAFYFAEKKSFKENINFIKVNESVAIKWEKKLNHFKKPIIAINWQGDARYSHDDMRSIPLSYYKEILNNKNFDFISLQKNFGSEQIKLNKYENFLVDLSNEIDVGENAFEDTIAILKKTNCVITSDTAIVHLAATLNIKTYLLLSYNPEWRWHIELKYKCFYPDLNIIQQKSPGNWYGVFKELNDRLKQNL